MTARRLLWLTLVCLAAQGLAPAIAPAGDDSPWPDSEALRPNIRALEREVNGLQEKVEPMETTVERYEDWEQCTTWVPVSEYGDPDRRFGYGYDEKDGTAAGFRPALAVDRRSRPRREDYMSLDFAREGSCESAAPRAGVTADAASVERVASPRAAIVTSSPQTVRSSLAQLERTVRELRRSARELERASERFDEWESCVSWVPVTEYGDPAGKFGYAFGAPGASGPRWRSTAATGTTPTTCSLHSWAATDRAIPARTSPAKRSTDPCHAE